jgi:hypothetical protein
MALVPMAALGHRASFGSLSRNFVLVFAGNLVGAIFVGGSYHDLYGKRGPPADAPPGDAPPDGDRDGRGRRFVRDGETEVARRRVHGV